ncbi:MAG: hypothetical protein HY791_24895 [Deltaproteobacteria bacterium]|nr:hypothetical protein [Deltaproteobacteria bacterium]
MTFALLIALTSALPPAARVVIEDPAELPRLRDNLAWVSLADRRFDPKEIARWFALVVDPFDAKSLARVGLDTSRRVDVYVGAAIVLEGTVKDPETFDGTSGKGEVALTRANGPGRIAIGRIAIGRKAHDPKELTKDLKRSKPKLPACAAQKDRPAVYGDLAFEEAQGRLGEWFTGANFAMWWPSSDLEICLELKPRVGAELAIGTIPSGGKALALLETSSAAASGFAHLGAESIRRLASRLGATTKDASVLGGDLGATLTKDGIVAAVSLSSKPAKERQRVARAEALGRLVQLVAASYPGAKTEVTDEHLFVALGEERRLEMGSKKPALDSPVVVELSPPLVFEALLARALRGEPGPSPMAFTVVRMGFGAFIDSMKRVSVRAGPRPGRLEVTARIERRATE